MEVRCSRILLSSLLLSASRLLTLSRGRYRPG
uniref:Uncharacterized protein n=1 Tax=Phocoena sinus TaxID=42100 RepID=A0A8C9DZI6_PHOSS